MSVYEETTPEDEMSFQMLTVLQEDAKDTLLKIRASLPKTAKDRRTAPWSDKISTKVCALRVECQDRQAQIVKCAEYDESDYKKEGVYNMVEEACESILTWLEQNLVKAKVIQSSVDVKMRHFYCGLVTRYLDEHEGHLEDNMSGVDYDFIMSQIDKFFSKFVVHNDAEVAQTTDFITVQQLQAECSSLASRVQSFYLSIKKVAPAENKAQSTFTATDRQPGNSHPLTLEAVVNALTAAHTPKSDFRLPRMELLKFDGDSDKWRDFKERFVALVHSNSSVSASEKMHYLKSSLTGEALDTVKNMSLSQYEEGWTAVMRRYQNKKILAYNAMRKLFALPSATERSSDVKKLMDSVKLIRYDLSELGESVDEWNSIFVFIISERLPKDTFEAWEQSCVSKTVIQPLAALEDFLENRMHTLLAMEKSFGKGKVVHAAVVQVPSIPSEDTHPGRPVKKESKGSGQAVSSPPEVVALNAVSKCAFCSQKHRNYKCPKLTELSPNERRKLVDTHELCVLCLSAHAVESCKYSWRCRKCNEKHNSRLHVDVVSAQLCNSDGDILLATVRVNIHSPSGQHRTLRVLIDQGSMRSFVTEAVVQSMHLPRVSSNTVVSGIGASETESRGFTQFTFASRVNPELQFSVNAEILPVVARDLNELSCELPNEFSNLVLADKLWWKGGTVDAVFGAAVYSDILMSGMVKATMLAQETHLGWILSGRTQESESLHSSSSSKRIFCYAAVDATTNLDHLLQRFWETEEKFVSVPAWTKEQQEAEEFYCATTSRDDMGSYVCRLPLKADFSLGQSRGAAVANLFKLEKRFEKNAGLKERYVHSMDEYISLGHAVPVITPPPPRHCYLPHLAVIKEESLTTKTRVVFNASSPTSNKRSLNDNLLIGPTVQTDLEKKMLSVRMHKLVFICDIEKMYRQIKMHVEDQDLQRFVWRSDPSMPIQDFRLTTVTFGQASAPFTATRTLVQLARDVLTEFPIAAKILLGETYVDDLHFGSATTTELLTAQKQLTSTLSSAGFSARKYSSNCIEFIDSLPDDIVNHNRSTNFLGVIWDVDNDLLRYPDFKLTNNDGQLTKRMLLAKICSIFDPLGWVQPLVVPAKVLMQSLWSLKLNWNDNVPDALLEKWQPIMESLNRIPELSINRWTGFEVNRPANLFGFCDASQRAYGACVYIRTPAGVQLLVAKSRVSPLNNTSIPRLELMGAMLLADLMSRVASAFSITLPITCWCDSRVALHWIQGEPSKWKPFIRNRAVFIRQLVSPDCWFYVQSSDNPADLVSRGCTFLELVNHYSLWMHGPNWLMSWEKEDAEHHSLSTDECNIVLSEELKNPVVCVLAIQSEPHLISELIDRHSSFYRLCRIFAWMIRFATNSRGTRLERNLESSLSLEEINSAERMIVKHLQEMQFSEDLNRLRAGHMVIQTSKLKSLAPFIDELGVLRVGGRLSRSLWPFEEQHPIILKYVPIFASVIERHHLAVCHGGPVLTLGNLRKKFWLLNGTQIVKKWVRACITCHRFRPILMQQMMAALPPMRLSLTKPFYNTGVDFAGPVTLKAEVGRGSRNYKGYIAVFVCLATKAIHLEVIGSLSADSFMAALRRFVGRRGPVAHMYSDNGTNNVGVFRRLEAIQDRLQVERLKWSFIPPGAPHFGGLWEAGVKSMKTHLKKTLGTTTCTFEELTTVVVQVEAVLNARPLCPFSGDVEDITALTPSHFLTGHQYVPLPGDDENDDIQLLNRFEYLQSLFRNICQRYQEEYCTRLQQRPKWVSPRPPISIGQLVLVTQDNVVTSKWELGRVVDIHPGADDITRVVTLRTKDGYMKRPISKISPLPLDNCKTVLTDEEIEELKML